MRMLAIEVRNGLFGIAVSVLCASCMTVLSPEEMQNRGTREYTRVKAEEAVSACSVALDTLGYRVTVSDAKSGIIRTAPKSFMVTTSGTVSGSASYANVATEVQEDGLAWVIQVKRSGEKTVVRATPHGFRNGSEMHKEKMWVAEVMDSKFADLWGQIEANLPAVH